MSRFKIEYKWALLISLMILLWMALEEKLGWHDQRIAHYTIYKMSIMLPIVLYFGMALGDKRKNFYNGKMTFGQSFLTGLKITLLLTLLGPILQLVVSLYISPHFFKNAIEFAIQNSNEMSQDIEKYFCLSNYIIQSTVQLFLAGLLSSFFLSLFIRRHENNLT